MSIRRCITLAEAMELVTAAEDLEEEPEIAILPPDDNLECSDVESLNDEILDAVEPGEVSGQLDVQLQPAAQDDDDDDSGDECLATYSKSKRKKPTVVEWSNGEKFSKPLAQEKPPSVNQANPTIATKSPFDLFIELMGIDYH